MAQSRKREMNLPEPEIVASLCKMMRADKMVRSVCPVCPDRDGILVYVKEGRIVGIQGDTEHPTSRGHICIKGTKAHEFCTIQTASCTPHGEE